MNPLQETTNLPTQERFQQEIRLSPQQRQDIIERLRPSALMIHETIRLEGEHQLLRPTSALAWSALAAGLSMGFSLVTQGLLRANLPDQSWSTIVSSLGYSVGFVIVVMGRQQLFTENTLTVMLPFLSHTSRAIFLQVLRLWGTVLLGNLIGAGLFAAVIGQVQIFSIEVQQAFTEIGLEALKGGTLEMFWQAIFAGWLIALMVWLLPSAEASQFWVIILITSLVGLAELPHSIAGSVEVLYLVMTGAITWMQYLGHFLMPTLLGNIVGGVSLVAALNHAQVAAYRD
ncbi:MAG: formate/nitrite transporter family protein [Leptolyngbya sp. Prado105]|jgi:formate/nitrite transporter FocA (FNT family)|nr:formate/nitrite transporter family protein [Leptolyngbya sp. Prado105]